MLMLDFYLFIFYIKWLYWRFPLHEIRKWPCHRLQREFHGVLPVHEKWVIKTIPIKLHLCCSFHIHITSKTKLYLSSVAKKTFIKYRKR